MPLAPNDDHLLNTLFQLTGIPWSFYWGDKDLLGIQGSWQLMPLHPRHEGDFWLHHISEDRNWFDSKPEAAFFLIQDWIDFHCQKFSCPPSKIFPFLSPDSLTGARNTT